MTFSRAAITAVLLCALCNGCENWTGFGFRADSAEMQRLRQVLRLEPGKALADIGAGKGELTLALAREVRRVYATDINAERLEALRIGVREAGLANVTVIQAGEDQTGLPADCCDAIVLRRVYHHLANPQSVNASLMQALRPGGVLAVIDFPPPFFWRRGSLGVPARAVIAEVSASGLEPLELINDWPGRGPLPSYCLLFRKSVAGRQGR